MKVIHVLRKPLASGSVAQNVLDHGCGGLNVDAGRIAGIDPANAKRIGRDYTSDGTYFGEHVGQKTHAVVGGNLAGRWPANLVLQHFPGCRKVGTRQIKGSSKDEGFSPITAPKDQAIRLNASVAGINRVGYANEDGTENIEAWDCEPGCPVAELDGQSGDCPTGAGGITKKNDARVTMTGPASHADRTTIGYADSGGASRFFKQIRGEPDE